MDGQYRNPYLCITIVGVLGAGALLSILGIIITGLLGKEPSSALVAAAAGTTGALSSFLSSPPRHSVGFDWRPTQGDPQSPYPPVQPPAHHAPAHHAQPPRTSSVTIAPEKE